jgi:hypothetical protein
VSRRGSTRPGEPPGPSVAISELRISRLQRLGAAALVAVSLVALARSILTSPEVPFIFQRGGRDDVQWITAPSRLDSNAIRVDLENVPIYTFEKSFELAARPASAPLAVRALRSFELYVNRERVSPREPSASWKRRLRLDVAEHLVAGSNRIRVEVQNPHGPALLELELDASQTKVRSNASWTVAGPALAPDQHAVRADDTRLHPQSFAMPPTAELLVKWAPVLVFLFAASAGLTLVGSRVLRGQLRTRAPELTLALATLFWIAVYVFKMSRLPVMMGFDIGGHLFYIDFLLGNHALPLATDGWSTYHPPVFYLLTALLVGVFDVVGESGAGRFLYRFFCFAAGLGNVWLCYFLARRLFERDPLKTSLAVAVTALLPMNVYMAAYVSNEPLHSAWVSLALLLACDLMLRRGHPPARVALLAVALGLAVLTKFTGLLMVPTLAFFVGAKAWLLDTGRLRRGVGAGLMVVLGTALVAGWFYLRNWIHFGTPFVWNVNLPTAWTWWEQPGFHTPAWYTGFGQALRHPFFAGYHSFWDAIYSTLWGDGLVAGMVSLSTRHEMWNYDFMTLGYWLAFPATVLMLVGFARGLVAAFGEPDLHRRFAMAVVTTALYVIAFALFYVTFGLAYYAQAKAFYALAAVLPLSIVAALGLSLVPDYFAGPRFVAVRALYYGWLGTLAGVLVLAFLG